MFTFLSGEVSSAPKHVKEIRLLLSSNTTDPGMRKKKRPCLLELKRASSKEEGKGWPRQLSPHLLKREEKQSSAFF